MRAIHFICRRDGEGHRNLIENEGSLDKSGNWYITEQDASWARGGLIFLHPMKKHPAFYGGFIVDYSKVEIDHKPKSERIQFEVNPIENFGKLSVSWNGFSHQRAHYSGKCTLPLEDQNALEKHLKSIGANNIL